MARIQPKYRIESAWIKQDRDNSREVWFLDRLIYCDDGHTGTSNICSGTYDYCLKRLDELNREEHGK